MMKKAILGFVLLGLCGFATAGESKSKGFYLGAAAGFSVNMVYVKVDRETGRVDATRFTAIQDAGTAIHPAFC